MSAARNNLTAEGAGGEADVHNNNKQTQGHYNNFSFFPMSRMSCNKLFILCQCFFIDFLLLLLNAKVFNYSIHFDIIHRILIWPLLPSLLPPTLVLNSLPTVFSVSQSQVLYNFFSTPSTASESPPCFFQQHSASHHHHLEL